MTAARTPIDAVDGINVVVLTDGRRVHLDDIATAAEGSAILDDVDTAIIAIENQLAVANEGISQNHADWRRRASKALKLKRRLRPRLQQRIGALRRAERQAAAPPAAVRTGPAIDRRRVAFINAAEQLLDAEVFTEIWARAAEIEPAAFAEGGRP